MLHLPAKTKLCLCTLFGLLLAQSSHAVTNFTWTGTSSSLFSTAGNWFQDQPVANTPAVRAPSAANGDDATFFQGGVANRTVDIGATRRNVRGMTFNSVAGANGFTFVVNGALSTSTAYGINLRPDGIINNDDDNQLFNVPIQFFTYAGGGPNSATLFPITAAAGDLTFSGTFASGSTAKETIIMSGGTMVVDGAFNVTIGTTGSGLITGTGSLITKNGAGTLTLGGTAANTYTGGTTVNNGSVVAGKVNALGSSAAYVTVNAGSLNVGTFNQTIGALTNAGGTINGSATITASSITLSAGTVNAVLGGTGALTKQGVGTATLTAANLFSGNTAVKEGTLALTGSGSIANSPNITVDSGATLDVSGVSGTFAVGASQTLKGGGSVVGNVIANGTVSPGASIGTLTFNAALTLNGLTLMEIDRSGTPNADLISAGSIAQGGTLTVQNIGAALLLGDTFDLFNGTLSGSFSTVNLPTLSDPSWSWDTSGLPVSGTITVIPEPSSVTLSLIGGFSLALFLIRRRK
jgi:fibronectin-binding autotransporter adhesin